MKNHKMMAIAASLATGLLLSACATNESTPPASTPAEAPSATSAAPTTSAPLSGTLNAGGSTAQTAAQDAWRSGFQNANGAVTVNYDPVGSGAGRSGFASGSYAVTGTDDAFAASELTGLTQCTSNDIVEVPAYISPIAVAFNLPGVTSLNLDAAAIANLLTGAIKTWDDPAIAALNPGVSLPPTAVTPVHRSDKSGTTGNFTDYLTQAAASQWTYGVVETWPDALGGEAAQGTQGVVAAIQAAAGAVGYIDASQSSGLGVTTVVNAAGAKVTPTATGAAATLSASSPQPGRGATDLAYAVNRTATDPTAYPVIMVSYLVGCLHYQNAATGTLAKAYMLYAVSAAGQQAAASNAGSAPLGSDLIAKASTAIDSIS